MYSAVFFDLGDTLVRGDNTKTWEPGAKSVLESLHFAGVNIGLLSNTGDLSRAQLKSLLPDDFPWGKLKESLIILSSEVGIAKPKLEIFQHAIGKAGVAGIKCIYCSENLVETVAAQQAGMHGARVLRGDLLKPETLKVLGV